ncbi:hypothetical protein Nmel_013845 [Mimus melanotis]
MASFADPGLAASEHCHVLPRLDCLVIAALEKKIGMVWKNNFKPRHFLSSSCEVDMTRFPLVLGGSLAPCRVHIGYCPRLSSFSLLF